MVNNEQSIINATKLTSTCSICYQNNNVNCYSNTILNRFLKESKRKCLHQRAVYRVLLPHLKIIFSSSFS